MPFTPTDRPSLQVPEPLKVIGSTPNQDLIELLKGLLESAESGDLQAIVYAGLYRGGRTGNGWSDFPGQERTRMIGELHEVASYLHQVRG